jgi:hypothetical protein
MMGDIMNWRECEREFIKLVEPDLQRIRSIIGKAEFRLIIVKKIEKIKQNISFIVEGYYEVIKELLVAYLLKNGLKSGNHQCLISYFYKQNPNLENEAKLISQMSFFRNRLDYYGEDIPEEFFYKNKDEFERIIKIVSELINNKGVKK